MKSYFCLLPDFLKKRREKLASLMKPNSIAILLPEEHQPKSADATFPYFQNTNLYYLTGIPLPDTYLILYPQHPDPYKREILFTKFPDPKTLTWDMIPPTLDEISKISGIKNVNYSHNFSSILHELILRADYVYLSFNEHYRKDPRKILPSERMTKKIIENYPQVQIERLSPLLTSLRIQKTPEEISLIKKAIEISEMAYKKLLKEVHHMTSENEVEGFLYYQIMREGASNWAFEPIIASGINSTILHYSLNNSSLIGETLLLVDFGVSFNYYNSDITRCIFLKEPSNFQKKVFDAVLEVHNNILSNIKVGVSIMDLTNMAKQLTAEKLYELGLMSKSEFANKEEREKITEKYFPHKIGHYLGLDVHDVGDIYAGIPENSVITCEPGIYIREKSIGIRIENDILVKKDSIENLSANIPIF